MNGPFDAERQARELPQVRAIYNLPPGTGQWQAANRAMLTDALTAAGVELGAYDERIATWLAGWEPHTVAVIASWITRAAGNRCQRCGHPAPEGSDWCAACEDQDAAEAVAVLRQAADEEPGGAL